MDTRVSLLERLIEHNRRRVSETVQYAIANRHSLTALGILYYLDGFLSPDSQTYTTLTSLLPIIVQRSEDNMEVDTATSAQTRSKSTDPHTEILCYLFVLLFLIDNKVYHKAEVCASACIAHLKSLKRMGADILAHKLYFYCSLSYELTDNLAEIRGELLALHRLVTLHHDELGQEILFNLLLRNYLHYNLYDHAEKLRPNAPSFGVHSNQQHCRYLFYIGKIQTIHLEYTDAKESLLEAARKAPVRARGFRIQCNKWAVIVRLLLGEIPERTTFTQKGMEKELRPYFELTNAVRIGELVLFQRVAEKFCGTFNKDRTHNLIARLRRNVIWTGLRNISMCYSRISFVDVARKLRLNSIAAVADTESIIAKAIRDGAVDSILDHVNEWMLSKVTRDIYSTTEPQAAFDSRITFCLNMHNEAVRALRYPPTSRREKENDMRRKIQEKWIEDFEDFTESQRRG